MHSRNILCVADSLAGNKQAEARETTNQILPSPYTDCCTELGLDKGKAMWLCP